MNNRIVIGCAVVLLTCLLTTMVWGQATAQISGAVKDQSGAVLPGVEVTATQTDTGIVRTTVTNETGSYVLSNLATGPYKLEAALPGFRTFVQNGIVLQVNANPVVNPTLEVGQVSEQVEVQANAALVETRSVGVGQIVENARILELPLNGRNIQDLVTLTGTAVSTGAPRGVLGGGQLYSISGGLAFGTDYSLDGANHLNFAIGSTMTMPFPDATQEFKVESTGLSASKGNSASVAVVTKSGTNELHGDLFEFVRNDLFNATSYFATINPATGNKAHGTLKRNQFGGVLGGPIKKNKLFFFGGYQNTILRSDPANNQQFIVTPAMLAGDWTAFTSAGCNAGRQRTLGAPFVNNRIDPAQYSKVAVFIANKVLASQPIAPDACGLVTVGSPTYHNETTYVGKVDFQKSDKHALFGRVLFNPLYEPSPDKLSSNVLNGGRGTDAFASSYAFGSTYLVSANTVQAFRLALNRNANHQFARQSFSVCDGGATDIFCGYAPTWISGWSITGGFAGLGTSSGTGSYWVSTQYQLNDDVTIVRGAHQFAFGVGATNNRFVERTDFAAGGSFTFTGGITGLGMGDFMTGKIATFQQSGINKNDLHDRRINTYATDTWKLSPKLTMNYGLRWEPFLPVFIPNIGPSPGATYNFDHNRFIQGVYSTVFTNAPAGFYYRGDPGFPNSGVKSQWLHFSPRLGLAWDVSGDGKTSVRASYAYGYAFLAGDWREDTAGSNPWGGRVSISNPPGGLDAPWKGIAGGNPFPYSFNANAPFLPRGQFKSDPYNLTTPQTYSWNLAIQRQFAGSWVASGSYLATRAMHLWGLNAGNPAVFLGTGPCTLDGLQYATCSTTANTDARRRLSLERPRDGDKIGPLGIIDDGGTSTYHAMLLSLERRAAKGVSLSTNYTFSHCINPYTTTQALKYPPDDTYLDPNNRNLDRGNCGSDRRHLVTLTSLWQTPKFSNKAVNIVASDWRISGIYRYTSGRPLDVTSGVDQALNGIAAGGQNSSARQRPNQILADAYVDRSGGPLTQWLNRNAFVNPAVGSYGNVGYNQFVGPSNWGIDAAVSRTFNVREMQRLEFRAEAFNLTNSFMPGNPATAINGNTFGVLRTQSTTVTSRVLQFALKYVF